MFRSKHASDKAEKACLLHFELRVDQDAATRTLLYHVKPLRTYLTLLESEIFWCQRTLLAVFVPSLCKRI